MKSILLRLTLAAAVAFGGLTACKKSDGGTASGLPTPKIKRVKKKNKDKDKQPKDATAPATPAP